MIDDPIVEEVYQARLTILDKWQGDLGKWLAHLRALESRHADRVITPETMRATNGRQQFGEATAPNLKG
jgi:hypothetical protein